MKRGIVIFVLLLLRKILRVVDLFHSVNEQKCLFIRIDHLGDVICSLPAVEEYMNANKTHLIDLLVTSPNASLFESKTLPFRVLQYREKPILNLLKTMLIIRNSGYKNIFILHTSMAARNILPTILSTKSIIHGFTFKSKFYNFYLDKKTTITSNASDTAFRYEGSIVFDLVKQKNVDYEPPYTAVFERNNFINQTTSSHKIGFFTTVFNHEARRMWGIEKFALLADLLISKYNVEILLFGGPSDFNYNEKIIKFSKYPKSIDNISGKYQLSKIPSIIDSLSLVVCVASGLMHIAMALQKEVIILLGPTPMERWIRKMYFNDCIRVGLDCQPCEWKIAPGHCFKEDFECMKKIEVRDVFEKTCDKIKKIKQDYVESNFI